jgi:hypothetical protein
LQWKKLKLWADEYWLKKLMVTMVTMEGMQEVGGSSVRRNV